MTSKLYDPRTPRLGERTSAESIDEVAARILEIERTIAQQNGALDEAFEQLRSFDECTFGLPNSDLDEIEEACVPRQATPAGLSAGQKC